VKFGQRIRELRLERTLTQAQLAEAAGVDHTYLSKIESGGLPYTPSAKTVRALAAALRADEMELLRSAGKIPTLLEPLADIPEAREFMRRATGRLTSRADWQDILRFLDQGRRTRRRRPG
jgi:transcriptional regulator with XRE-family HTH domain